LLLNPPWFSTARAFVDCVSFDPDVRPQSITPQLIFEAELLARTMTIFSDRATATSSIFTFPARLQWSFVNLVAWKSHELTGVFLATVFGV
jgi:hypothetical protein